MNSRRNSRPLKPRSEPQAMIHVSGPGRNALKVWNDLHRRRGQWQNSELFGDTFRFVGSVPIAELDDYYHWVEPLVGADGRIDTFLPICEPSLQGRNDEISHRRCRRALAAPLHEPSQLKAAP